VGRIILLSYNNDVDVSEGLSALFNLHPELTEVLIPVIEDGVFAQSAINSAKQMFRKFKIYFAENGILNNFADAEDITLCGNPNKEIIRQVQPGDVLALVWDDSHTIHMALHSLEDFGLETWDISNGLEPIEVPYGDDGDDPSEMYEQVVEGMNTFLEKMVSFITASVLDVLSDTIKKRIEEDDDHKDISPFDEK